MTEGKRTQFTIAQIEPRAARRFVLLLAFIPLTVGSVAYGVVMGVCTTLEEFFVTWGDVWRT